MGADSEKRADDKNVFVRFESPEKSEAFIAGFAAGARDASTKWSYMLFGLWIASLMFLSFKYVCSGKE